MAKVSRSILNGYNKCSALATKWTNILDSFRHKDEKIAIEDIDGDLTIEKTDSVNTTSSEVVASATAVKTVNDKAEDNASNIEDLESGKAPKDSPTFTGDVTGHSFVGNGSKLTGIPLPDNWVSGIVITPLTTKFYCYNGSIYEFVLDLSTQPNNEYTTTDIQEELDGEELIWVNKISTYPKPDFITFEPIFLAPSATKQFTFTGSFLTRGSKVSFYDDLGNVAPITISDYIYIDDTTFKVTLASDANIADYNVRISNGVEIELLQKIAVTDGVVVIAGSDDAPWVVIASTHVLGLGYAYLAEVTGTGQLSFASNIQPNQDCILSFRVDKESVGSLRPRFLTSQSASGQYNGLANIFINSQGTYQTNIQNDELFEILISGSNYTFKVGGTIIDENVAMDRIEGGGYYPRFLLSAQTGVKDVTFKIIG